MDPLLLIAGLVLVVWSADALVKSAEAIATTLRVPGFLIGATLVAAGTSLPELVVGLFAAWENESGLVVGNVVGSNIANILLVLGIGLVLFKGRVLGRFTQDISVTVGLTAGLAFFALDAHLSAMEGLLLCLGGLSYGISLVKRSSGESLPHTQDHSPLAKQLLLPVLHIAMLSLGGRFLVDGALGMATSLEMSTGAIGLTIIAIGTSLPEVATTVSAFKRSRGDLAVGNILGSCIFNIASVLGLSALVADGLSVASSILSWHIPLALVSAILLVPTLDAARWSRAGGIFLLSSFVAFVLHVATETPPIGVWATLLMSVGILPLLTLSENRLQLRTNANRVTDSGTSRRNAA